MPKRIQVPGLGIVEFPDEMSDAQIEQAIRRNLPSQEPPAAVSAGKTMMGVPRQIGLTARYALEGIVPPLVDTLSAPLRYAASKAGVNIPPLQGEVSKGLTALGMPEPEGANERVIGDMARTGFGALGFGGGAQAISSRASSAPVKAAADVLAANPLQQVGAAAGAGGAGGSVREAGGGPWSQFAAALAGGVAGGSAASGMQTAFNAAVSKLRPTATMQEVEQQITLALRGSGVDWNRIPERIKQGMREEVKQALSTGGQLNPAATRRLVDFKATGATPTRGMLTQDPVQITREQNLAKVGANSTDIGLQQLPNLQNQNASRLLSNLDELGAKGAPDAYSAGTKAAGAVAKDVARSRSNIDRLYGAARDTSGRSAELNGAVFTQKANQAIDEALLGYAVPKSVQDKLNQIAKGEVPFTVDFAEQLKTVIGNIGAAGKGDATTKAMGIIRKALDDTPLRSAPQVNPRNLPAIPGMVPESPAVLGSESIQAFNRARQANRGFMQRVENSPALEAVYRGMKEGRPVDPDNFVKQFIIGQGASVADVRSLRRSFAADPEAQQAVKQFIVAHLKSAATNNTDDVVKFSSSAFSKALDSIGDRKLAVFFSPDEIMQLQAIKRTGTLMQAQPVGTAVNNSNTGALMIGRVMDVLDRISGKLPLGADTMVQGIVRGVQQGNALNVPRSLTAPPMRGGLLQNSIPPAIYGGLLTAPAVEQ